MAYLGTPLDFRSGEQGPLSADFSVTSGTGTIEGVATGATVSLVGPTVIPVPGWTFDPTQLSVSIASDALSGSIQYNLATVGLPPNIYYVQFRFSPLITDFNIRIAIPDLQIRVIPYVESIATFDPLTIRGAVRSELQDISDFMVPGTAIGITSPVFTDSEVDMFIARVGGSLIPNSPCLGVSNSQIYLAAHYGWTNIAANKATLVKVKKILFIQSSTKPTFDAALEMAQTYLNRANAESGVIVVGSNHEHPRRHIEGYNDTAEEMWRNDRIDNYFPRREETLTNW